MSCRWGRGVSVQGRGATDAGRQVDNGNRAFGAVSVDRAHAAKDLKKAKEADE